MRGGARIAQWLLDQARAEGSERSEVSAVTAGHPAGCRMSGLGRCLLSIRPTSPASSKHIVLSLAAVCESARVVARSQF